MLHLLELLLRVKLLIHQCLTLRVAVDSSIHRNFRVVELLGHRLNVVIWQKIIAGREEGVGPLL